MLTILEITSTSITVSWRPPQEQLEERSIISYLITVTDTMGNNVVNEVKNTTLNITVPELLPDHAYRVAVAAVSREGVSPSISQVVKTKPVTSTYICTQACLYCSQLTLTCCLAVYICKDSRSWLYTLIHRKVALALQGKKPAVIVVIQMTICDSICEKGPLGGQCKYVGTSENSRKVNISCNHGLLHHQNLQCIPYLQTKFETCTAFLRVKQGQNSFTAEVILFMYGVYRKCDTDRIR